MWHLPIMRSETVRCSLPVAFKAPNTVPTMAQQSPTKAIITMNHRMLTVWVTITPQQCFGSSLSEAAPEKAPEWPRPARCPPLSRGWKPRKAPVPRDVRRGGERCGHGGGGGGGGGWEGGGRRRPPPPPPLSGGRVE